MTAWFRWSLSVKGSKNSPKEASTPKEGTALSITPGTVLLHPSFAVFYYFLWDSLCVLHASCPRPLLADQADLTPGWIQRDVPEPWAGWSRSGHFLPVDLPGNESILNCFCASSLPWTEFSCLHNVFSELCLQSHAGCIPLLSSSAMWPWRSGILLLLTLASRVPWRLYLLCLLKKTHFYYWQHSRPNKAEAKGVVLLCFKHHCQ